MARKIRPNIVSGGTAIDLGNNLYYMRGKTHKQGGINIGSNPETGINVEKGEVVQTSPKGLRVFSAQPILNGISPANALLMGGNPNNIFNAQEAWKQANHYNDDGTKFEGGGYTPSKEIIDYIKKTEGFRDKWYKDGNGIDTIGYGFTGSRIKKLYPNGITREQADKEFADSIAKRALILAKDTPNWNKLSQKQRDALLSYHYNVGEGSYRNKHKKLQQALADSDWENVVLNMDAGYNDKKNPGLRARRDYERELFRSGMVASLTGDEEKAFRTWYDRYSRSQNLDPNPDAKEHYYDYRTYWKNRTEQQKNDEWKLGNHLPDTYKKPGHPTFSTESIYSTRKTPGGTWKKVGLGPVYDEQFVAPKNTRRLKTYQNVSFALGGDDLKQNGYIEPSVITVPLPKKFKGSQAAARRYAEGYQFGKQIAEKRDKTVPYIAATAALPFIIGEGAAGGIATNAAINTFRTAHPLLAKGVSTVLTADGIRNVFSKNGVQKTVKLAKEGKTGRAVLSGLGDVADLAGFIDIANTGRRILNPAYRSLHFYNTITPFSYDDPIERGVEWVKNMIANTPVDINNPLWMRGERKQHTEKMAKQIGSLLGWKNSVFTDRGRIALEARDDAFRIYNGLPQKYGTFVKNKNGTYSYNLPKLKYENGSFKPVIGENYDTIGGAGGNVKESILNNLDGDVVVRQEDLWDLQPFKGKNIGSIIDNAINNSVQNFRKKVTFPLREKINIIKPIDNYLNRFRNEYHIADTKFGNRLTKLLNNFEAGQITGSKPFKLDTKFSGHSTMKFIDDDGIVRDAPYRYIDGPAQNILFNTDFTKNKVDFNKNNIKEIDLKDLIIPNVSIFKMGGIHIKPSKRGTFTAAAKRHHMGVQEFARTVLNNRARFSAAMVKKANFARNASKWHKKELGGDMTKQYYITRDNIYSLGGNVRRKAPLGTEDIIPIKKIKVNNRDAWDVDGRIVYSEAEAYRLAGQFADARGRINMSETLEPSIVTAERPTSSSNSSTTDAIPISKIKVNGKDAWDVDGRIIFNEQEAYRYRSRLADIQGSYDMSEELNPAVVTAERTYRRPSPGARQNTIGFDSSLAGVSYYGPNRNSELPEQQTYTPPTQRTRLPINTSGRPTTNILGIIPLRPYDGRPIETPTSGTQSSSTGGQRRNSNRPTTSSAPTAPVIPVDYDAIDTQINNENNRILTQSLNNDILTPITGRQLSPIVSASHQGLAGGTSVRTVPNNPYYSRLNVGLHKIGNYIKNNPDIIGLGVNLTGNLAASLINRSAIKGMRYVDAPIPISAQKLPTEVNIEPQVSSIKENVAGQERLIADNTADSRVALARRQRVRNQGAQQYQTLFGNKLNTELQLLTADRLNRQGVDAQNVGQYNRWRAGLYDFENRRREMLAENSVAGINNAAEAIAGERGYLARREARKQDARNRALIALTSPNAQKVFDANPGLYEELIRKMSKYGGNFSLLRKRINR